jgi:hypothetical protein
VARELGCRWCVFRSSTTCTFFGDQGREIKTNLEGREMQGKTETVILTRHFCVPAAKPLYVESSSPWFGLEGITEHTCGQSFDGAMVYK